MATEFYALKGSLGVLVAITFVVFELCLVPLFEYAREGFTITQVRRRIAQQKSVKICPERSIPVAFGLSDGVHGYSTFITVPRSVKIFFKFALTLSIFAWEFELDTFDRAEMVAFQFNDLGPFGLKNQSSLMFPVPIASTSAENFVDRRNNEDRSGSGNETYTRWRLSDLGLDYAAHCLSRAENGRRVAFAAIYSHDKEGQRKIYCLNGTDYREKAEILSFNPNPADVVRSPVLSVSLEEDVGPPDRTGHLHYYAKVTIPDTAALNGTHQGLLKIGPTVPLNSNLKDFLKILTASGFLIHSTKGTVMKVYWMKSPRNGSTSNCPSNSTNATGDSKRCVTYFDRVRNTSFSYGNDEVPYAEDIDLRLYENAVLKYGRPLHVFRAWVAEAGYFSGENGNGLNFLSEGSNFAEQLWNELRQNVFYYSTPMKTQLSLRVGTLAKHVKMEKWSTITMLVILSLFVTYCVTSIVVMHHSGISTGISSECITRTAILEYVRRDASLQEKQLLAESENSLTLGAAPLDSGGKQHVGFILDDHL